MVKDGDFDPSTYNNFAVHLLSKENDIMVIEYVLKTAIYGTLNYIIFEQQQEQKDVLFNLIIEHLYYQHKQLKNLFIESMAEILDSKNYEQVGHLLYFLKKEPEKLSLLRGESETLENFAMAKEYDLSGLSEVYYLINIYFRKQNILS